MINEVSLYVKNRPGELAGILKVLEDVKVNILGLTIDQVEGVSLARFILDDPETAKEALEKHSYPTSTTKIFAVQVSHEIGTLNRIVSALANGKINIRYTYQIQLRHSTEPVVIFRIDPKQEPEAEKIILTNKFSQVRYKDLVQ